MDTGTRPRTTGRPNLVVLPHRRSLSLAYGLSIVLAVTMATGAALGLIVDGLYADETWVEQALRGGDAVTLAAVVPLLVASLVWSFRGSRRARPVWIGVVAYASYCHAYRVFGTEFNDAFPLHIAALSTSIFALAVALPNLDLGAIAAPVRRASALPWIAGLLVVVGAIQAVQWTAVLLRFAFTGELLHDVPIGSQHLVCGLDLAVLVPATVLAGVLMWRRTAFGIVLGTALCVTAALHQISLMAARSFQANAGIAGVDPFPFESILLVVAFTAASLAMVFAPAGDDQAPARSVFHGTANDG